MGSITFRPTGNSSEVEWTVTGATSNWQCVDEETADDDSSYVSLAASDIIHDRDRYTLTNTLTATAQVNSVTVYWRMKQTNKTKAPSVRSELKLSGTLDASQSLNDCPSNGSYSDFNQTFTTKPGGGSWSPSDLDSLEFGVYGDLGTGTDVTSMTQCYIVVDHEPAPVPAAVSTPTGLQVDFTVHNEYASEIPNFSALYITDSASQWIKYGQVAVSFDSSFSSASLHVASSGWIQFSDSAFNNDRIEINWDSSGAGGGWDTAGILSSKYTSANPYYFKMQFMDTETGSTSNWSTVSWFCGFDREWVLTDYNYRHKLLFDTAHVQVDTSYTASFRIKTGNKKIIASNGALNESIQFGRTQHYIKYGNREHIFYLSELGNVLIDDISYGDEPHWGISVVTSSGESKGDPYLIYQAGTGFDSHYYPSGMVDNSGYLHVAFGCHDSEMKYLKSKYSNQSGSLDTGSGILWTNPANDQSTPASVGAQAAYPCFIYDKTDNVIYLFYRKNNKNFVFQRSTDGGQSWSMAYYVINDHHPDAFKVYNTAIFYDKFRRRLHTVVNHIHKIGNTDYSMGAWYIYSQYDDTSGGGSDVGFSVWRNINGEILGYSTSSPA